MQKQKAGEEGKKSKMAKNNQIEVKGIDIKYKKIKKILTFILKFDIIAEVLIISMRR